MYGQGAKCTLPKIEQQEEFYPLSFISLDSHFLPSKHPILDRQHRVNALQESTSRFGIPLLSAVSKIERQGLFYPSSLLSLVIQFLPSKDSILDRKYIIELKSILFFDSIIQVSIQKKKGEITLCAPAL